MYSLISAVRPSFPSLQIEAWQCLEPSLLDWFTSSGRQALRERSNQMATAQRAASLAEETTMNSPCL
jgi:hypothetical protein